MPSRWIWIRSKKYFYFDTFRNSTKAYKVAMQYRRRNNSRFFIVKREEGLFATIVYDLYMTKFARFP